MIQIDAKTQATLLEVVAEKYKNNMTWFDVADKMKELTGIDRSESMWRKTAKKLLDTTETKAETEDASDGDEFCDKMLELKKKIISARDERNQTGAYIRRLSREDTIKEIAHDFAEQMNDKKDLSVEYEETSGDKEAILQISDWHYGMVCDNHWNKYDTDIARDRINHLLSKTIAIGKDRGVNVIRVVNLSDLIAGRIHTQIRIESRYDVITQTMRVSEILAEFLSELSKHFVVEYYDCTDNHSRIEPNKKESLQLETLTRIIKWFLKERLAENKRININDNEYGDDIVAFRCLGHDIVGCHGDKDNPTSVVDSLTLMTHKHYDLCLTAHRHHFSAAEKCNTIVLSNGTLMGTDGYAVDLRLSSTPSQNLTIVSLDNVTESIYRIIF